MRMLIVNADDLGRTPGVNDGIFEAHRRGVVTSATLMVAHAAAEAAVAALDRYPELGVGLHVALSGGPTVLPPERVASLVDSAGRLPAKPEQLLAGDAGGPDPGEVADEVAAQLDRFRQLTGRLPTHLDGHHHCHRLPAVAAAVAEVARRHRLPVRGAGPDSIRWMRAAGLTTPDRFLDGFYGDGATLDGLLTALASLEPGVSELMCHPARVDATLADESSYALERERELAVLTDPQVLDAVHRRGIRLVHYGMLPSSPRG